MTVSIQLDDSGLYLAKQEFTVDADLSERYGYTDAYNGAQVTALDALVAAHIAMFGDDNLEEWLKVNNSGFVTLLAGEPSANSVFFVNGEFPDNETVTTVKLQPDDSLFFYMLQDPTYLSDNVSWFIDSGGNPVDSITVEEGEEFTVTLVGYWVSWAVFGLDPEDWIEPIEDAQIVILDVDDSAGFRCALFGEELGLTDEDGKLTIYFDEPGTYILSAYDNSGYDMPFTAPWLEVTVTPKDTEPDDSITVTFRLIGDTVHTAAVPTQYHDWIASRTVTVPAGSKVYDVFVKALDDAGLTASLRDSNNYVESITKDGVMLKEKENGSPHSGWKYLLNGSYPDVGLSVQPVSDGDVVVWHYVNDWGMEDSAWLAAYPDIPVLTGISVTTMPTKTTCVTRRGRDNIHEIHGKHRRVTKETAKRGRPQNRPRRCLRLISPTSPQRSAAILLLRAGFMLLRRYITNLPILLLTISAFLPLYG